MAYSSLRDFVKDLENAGELKRIKTKVSPNLEITEITDRVSKTEGPALLFENVEGSKMPLLINAFGSYQRMAMALGVENLDEVADEIEGMIKLGAPESLLDKVKILGVLAKLTNFPPKTVKRGACQEVVLMDSQVSLAILPIIKCWPLDADKYITLPQVFTHSLKTGQRNVGTYRLQRLDDRTLAMHWQIHHDGAAHYREYHEAGERMPVAVAIGGDPVMSYIGTAPLPTGIDELLFAGFLRKSNVPMVQCKTIDMSVPADADIVLEGYIEPDETCVEGPFGDHTGFYSLADEYPVFHLTAITHRKNPIYQTIIVGKPPMEDCYMGKATERIFLPLIRTQLPEVVDMNLPLFGVFHNFCLISIDKRYPFHAKKIMHSIWGLGQLMFSKTVIVVDKHVDVQNVEEVFFYVGSNVDAKRDVTIVEGPVDVLDHAAPLIGAGSKMGIDATTKWREEGYQREWPEEIEMSQETKDLVTNRWKTYGLG
ncbi:MAG: menaquinone biosynthesis decarboxylase [Candidatus Poribacteria bacterium]|nr:menaquinone biosynthesis decarboxylase [Candidatus Poribacteria bacterium]